MKIRVLGSRGEIKESAPRHARRSGLLLDGRLLFDLGEPEFLETKPERIFITHLHPDHAFFMRRREVPAVPVYAPETWPGLSNIRLFPGEMSFRGYRLRAVPTHHSLKVKSHAYLIEKGGRRMLYTGDMFWINKEYHPMLAGGRAGLDLVVTEASFVRKGGMIRRDKIMHLPYGHAGVPNLMELFAPVTRNILFIHFGSWFYGNARRSRQMLRDLGMDHGVNAVAGYDGMELDLEDLAALTPEDLRPLS